MRNVFYFLAAILAFGAAWYYYQDVSAQTATINKLRLVAEDGLVIQAGTVIDDDFMADRVVSQRIPLALAGEFAWALDDTAATRVNLRGRVFGTAVPAGSFLQRGHFFVPQQDAFARRIKDGYRAFSLPINSQRAVEKFIAPGAHVDVIATFGTDGVFASRRLLEDVEVMAVGDIDSQGEYDNQGRPQYQSVTLQAPADVVEAFLAESDQSDASSGELTLVLRNPCEGNDACVGGAAVNQ